MEQLTIKPIKKTSSEFVEILNVTDDGVVIEVLCDAGIFWGRFKVCTTWTGHKVAIDCDDKGRTF